MIKICSIDGCGKSFYAKGFCMRHYTRLLRYGDPLGGHTFHGAPAKWLQDHINYAGMDCLIWPFALSSGYGVLKQDRQDLKVHRVVCEHHHGPPPTPEHEAAHSCGNGHLGCVTPRHLRWATVTENRADAKEHGTWPHGESQGHAKLTREDVLQIRSAKGTLKSIGERFGVSFSAVHVIKKRKSWAWLD